MPKKPKDTDEVARRAREAALCRSARRSADEQAYLEQHGLKRGVVYLPRELVAGAALKVRRRAESDAWRRAGRAGEPPVFERRTTANGARAQFVEIDQ
jgi:hypothetical protein